MMNIGYFNGICFLTLKPGISFVEVVALGRLGGHRSEKATIPGHILKKIAEEIENE